MEIPFFPSACERNADGLPDIQLQNLFLAQEPTLLRQLGLTGPALIDFPGTTRWATVGAGPIRGVFYYPGAGGTILFVVSGTALYKVTSGASATQITGTISGTDLIGWAMIRDTVLLCADGKVWFCDGTTLTQITDIDLGTIGGIAAIDGRLLAGVEASDSLKWSDVFDPSSIGSLSFATAESYGDRLVRPWIHGRRVMLGGERSFEVWMTGPSSTAAFVRMGDAVMPIGLAARFSMAEAGPALFFVSIDQSGGRAVMMYDQGLSRISDPAIDRYLQTLSEANLAAISGFAFTSRGQTFYQLDLPGIGTYAYHVQAQTWSRRKWSTDTLWAGQCATYAYGKTLVGSRTDGKIWSLDVGVSTDDAGGSAYALEGIALTMIGVKKNTRISSLKVSAGVTGASGTPTVAVSTSHDGGANWSAERTVTLPKAGARASGRGFNWPMARDPGLMVKVRRTGDFRIALRNLYVNEPGAQ